MTLDDKYLLYKFLNENTCGETLRSDIMNEATSEDATIALLDKMLQLTLGRYNKIDFREIEKSRGDVMECKFYKSLRESIDILCDIDMKTHKIPGSVIVSTALTNLFNLREDFKRAYREKNGLAILLYNTMYYSVIEETSYLIAASVEFATKGDVLELDAIDGVGRENTMLANIEKFNKEVASGRVHKFINAGKEINKNASVEKVDESVLTEGIASTLLAIGDGAKFALAAIPKPLLIAAGILVVLVSIVPIIKACIYCIFKLRHNMSEDLKLQAELIERNAASLEYNNGDKKVIDKQLESAAKFRRIAKKFALDHDNAESEAKNEERTENLNVNALLI